MKVTGLFSCCQITKLVSTAEFTVRLSSTQLNDVELKEALGGDEKSWGLWHEHRGSVRRYTLQSRTALLKLSWLKDLKEQQQRSSLLTNSRWSDPTE